MRPAREIMQSGLILADGAMGTYFSQLAPREAAGCELANLTRPDLIRQIHQEYLAAGARFLRSNTFAAAALLGLSDPAKLAGVIRSGYALADECAGDLAFVAADFGPVYNLAPEEGLEASRIALDTYLELSADLYLFETFADPADFLPLCREIKDRRPEAVIIASFALSADGYTRKGLSLNQLALEMEKNPLIDIWGLNCGIGPTHLAEQLRKLPAAGKPLILMPNSGYPRQENQRMIFGSTPDYFANAVMDLADNSRTRLLGGCCGTTPKHISALRQLLDRHVARQFSPAGVPEPADKATSAQIPNPFAAKLARGEFAVICELDPPRNSQMDRLIAAARQLQLAGLDAVTLADSPLARVKMDPISCAARLFRETGLPVLPHLCCRDKNANALRSSLLAAHSEGIRQVLAITGDAIPESDKGFVKPVFNLNSFGLLQLINQMNQDIFIDDPFLTAAALDPGAANPDAELGRVLRKKSQGAVLFLTQPVFGTTGLPLIRQVRQAGLKVLVGLMPLISYRNARYLSEEVPGIRIPDAILERFDPDQSREEAIETGIQITRDIAAAIRQDADGFYLIAPFNRADIMVRLMAGLHHDGLL